MTTPDEEAPVDLQAIGDGFLRSGMVRFHEGLAPLMRRIDSVEQAPFNYNSGDIDAITESITINGMYRPIFVQQSTGYILAGNHTWLACKALDSAVVPVVMLDVDEIDAKRLMIADNRTASLAQPDNGLLLELLGQLDDAATLLGSGYTPHDMEVLEALAEIPLESPEFAQWPILTFKVPPHVKRAFERITSEANQWDDREQFELLLRLAGWDGH